MNQATPAKTTAHDGNHLEHCPVSIFAMVMGTGGLALAWEKAHAVLGAPAVVSVALVWLATLLFAFLAVLYLLKWVRYPKAAAAERHHPIRINFLPAISISLLLLAAGWRSINPAVAQLLWMVGAPLHLMLTLMAISSWIWHAHYDIKHANPAWFIPVVGNVIVPVAGAGMVPSDVLWFFFSVGIVFWPVLLATILYRVIFHPAMPERLMPTMFILLAPPAVGCLAWISLTGGVDAFARILYYCALFLLLLLTVNVHRFLRLPFHLPAWAYSFPLAAVTIATLKMAEALDIGSLRLLGTGLLAAVSLVVALLAVLTLRTAIRGKLCVPE